MKTCTKCGVEKDESEFYKDKTRKDLLHPWCKICIKEELKRNYVNNTEKINIRNRNWALKNKEISNQIKLKWSHDNIDKLKVSQYKYRIKNHDILLEKHYNWRLKNKDKHDTHIVRCKLKKQIGETPQPELVEVKLLINKTKQLCKTLKS